jgi:nitrate/nitrite transport system substrate-binding protein
MAQPLGFYERYGLNAQVIKTAGWAVARDKSLAGEYDASHMLTPMPLAMTLGAGSTATPYIMPAVENINGQAIVLSNEHKDKRDPKQWKGFTFGVPFEYSMHNFLLRYYVAEFGLDPDVDIQIRVVPPPEMVANLRAGNLDGYLSPDPFNQRAVWENIGFIHILTKEIWEGHPVLRLCGSPLLRRPTAQHLRGAAQVDHRCDPVRVQSGQPERDFGSHRADQLSQPAGAGDRAGAHRHLCRWTWRSEAGSRPHRFRPVPLALDGRLDPHPDEALGLYRGRHRLQGRGRAGLSRRRCPQDHDGSRVRRPGETYKSHVIMGKTFDPETPEDYVSSFAIGKG